MTHPLPVTTVTTVTSFRDIPRIRRKRKSEGKNLSAFVLFAALQGGIPKRVVTVVTAVSDAKKSAYAKALGKETT